jgi:excisionase family DNA binding protein
VSAHHLSPTQFEALGMLANGLTMAEVAHRTGRSENTIKNTISEAYRRLGVESNVQAYLAMGWLKPPRLRHDGRGLAVHAPVVRKRIPPAVEPPAPPPRPVEAEPESPDSLLTANEAAQLLRVHRNTLARLGDRGQLPFLRVVERGDRRYRRSDVQAYLRTHYAGREPVGE